MKARPTASVIQEPTLSPVSGGTLLHDAIMSGNHGAAALLLQEGIEVDAKEKSGHGWNGRSAAHVAVEGGNLEGLKLLVRHGADLAILAARGTSLLHYACRYGRLDIVEYLLSNAAKIDQLDKHYGVTPLHEAARIGHSQIVSLLLSRGVDTSKETKTFWFDTNVDKIPARQTAEQIAVLGKHQGVAKKIAAASKVSTKIDPAANAELWKAVKANSLKRITSALARGAVCDTPVEEDGKTALHHAARYGKPPVFVALLATSPSLNVKDSNGLTPMHMAAFGSNEIGDANLRRLLEAGAKLNTSTTYGSTPLKAVATSGNRELVQLLLDHGARVTKKTGSNAPPAMQRFLASKM